MPCHLDKYDFCINKYGLIIIKGSHNIKAYIVGKTR